MKKIYEKPRVEIVSFSLKDNIMSDLGNIDDVEQGVSSYDPDDNIFG